MYIYRTARVRTIYEGIGFTCHLFCHLYVRDMQSQMDINLKEHQLQIQTTIDNHRVVLDETKTNFSKSVSISFYKLSDLLLPLKDVKKRWERILISFQFQQS